jgi:hypothetical protein
VRDLCAILRIAALGALVVAALAVAGCSDDSDSNDDGTSVATAPDASNVSGAQGSALEGRWRTEPVTFAAMAATVRKSGLGANVEEFERNAPISDAPTALVLDVRDDWDLYGRRQGEPRAKIDYDARFEVTGDTVVVTHSSGTSNTFRWSVRDEVLELTWLRGTAPPYKGIPDEAYQRALYMTALFQREGAR